MKEEAWSRPGAALKDRLVRSILLSAILMALAVRLVVVGLVYTRFLDPSHCYYGFGAEVGQVARSIATGRGFANPYWIETGPTALLSPVFPYLLGGIFAIFGVFTKASALTFLTFGSLLSALTCVPIFLIAVKDFGSQTAWLAVWLWVFFPQAIYYSANSMAYTSLVALLLAFIFLAAQHMESSNRVWAWAGFGFLFGFSALTNPVLLGILPVLGGWLCFRLAQQDRPWVKAAMAGGLVLILTMAPWLIRNYRVFHRPVFLKDNFWMEICVGNLTNSPDWWNADIHPAFVPAEMAEFQRLGELGYMAEKRRQALTFILSNPTAYVERCLHRVVNVWTGFWTFHREYLRNLPLYLANIFLLTPLTILSIVGLCLAFRKAPGCAVPYLLILLSFPFVYYVTHCDARYRHPLDPLLVVLASSAVASCPGSRRGSAAGEPAAALAPREL